eukprot:TRINITY_DN41279_c0_g1_i1.p1 TRINITY_DN41279_c0_g1~~TRINITY_DN41279_c0_g1_i1.p1  ORF type:complete len:106 (-),score=44.46 TRINITY_DN41279_c0_g1_i1:69-386(-)
MCIRDRCECTDRSSTDDDVPLRQQLRDAQRVYKKKATKSSSHLNKSTTANGGEDPPLEPLMAVSYTHLRAHETPEHLVCRLLLEKKKEKPKNRGDGKKEKKKKKK